MGRRGAVLMAAIVVLLGAGAFPMGAAATIDPGLYAGLVWRNIGPFRGGRVAAVTGAVGQPGVFYMGLPLGGVWKTTSAGETWYPIFDAVKEASSVGAVEVAPSDPNVIYVGMGDLITGGGINEGNGVYKSTDAGKTWQHLGLDETKQIPSHPRRSARSEPRDGRGAGQHPHADSDDARAVPQHRRRQDVDEDAVRRRSDRRAEDRVGVRPSERDARDDRAPLHRSARAARRRHRSRAPPAAAAAGTPTAARRRRRRPTGPRCTSPPMKALTWKESPAAACRRSPAGRRVAVAMNTNAQRMYLIGNFGLYRSDDGGANWRQMAADDRRIANGQGNYNSGVYVDPKNPDIVYTLATSSYRSTDGGKRSPAFKGAPGGDDPQQMWIDPTDGKRMFLGVDQGATDLARRRPDLELLVQPGDRAGLPHLRRQLSIPYWVYATQQDSGSIATRSRGDLGEITHARLVPDARLRVRLDRRRSAQPEDHVRRRARRRHREDHLSRAGSGSTSARTCDTALALRKVGNQPLIFVADQSARAAWPASSI